MLPLTGGVDVNAVALAGLDDLGVAGHDGHAGRFGLVGNGAHDALEVGQQEAFL